MGSRLQPNHGGSGGSHSRKGRPQATTGRDVKYAPIETPEELGLYLSGEKIACLICGKEYKSLGMHVSRSHSISPDDYKVAHNIPITRSLCGAGLIAKKKAITKAIWRESPRMEGVRVRLKKNIHKLGGTKHKTKSSIPRKGNIESVKKAKAIQARMVREKYRAVYLQKIIEAINLGVTLYTVYKKTFQVYEFARRNPEDKEFVDLLDGVIKPDIAESGKGTELRLCVHCGDEFKARVKRNVRFCNRECRKKAPSSLRDA